MVQQFLCSKTSFCVKMRHYVTILYAEQVHSVEKTITESEKREGETLSLSLVKSRKTST